MKVIARVAGDTETVRVLEGCSGLESVAERLKDVDVLRGKEVKVMSVGRRQGDKEEVEVVYVKGVAAKVAGRDRMSGLMEQLRELQTLNVNAGGTGTAPRPRPAHSAPEIPDTDERFQFLKEMMCGEVSDAACRKALYYSGLDTEAAAEWLVQHLEDADLNTPITDQQLAELFPSNVPDPSELSEQLSFLIGLQ